MGAVLSQTLRKDSVKSSQEALIEIYRKMRPGDPPTVDAATKLFRGMFFDTRKYDFSRVGRMKFNIKLGYYTKLKERLEGKSSSLRVGSGNRFAQDNFIVLIGQEKILVGKRAGDEFTQLTRGYEGTRPADHPEGAVVQAPMDRRTLGPGGFSFQQSNIC